MGSSNISYPSTSPQLVAYHLVVGEHLVRPLAFNLQPIQAFFFSLLSILPR